MIGPTTSKTLSSIVAASFRKFYPAPHAAKAGGFLRDYGSPKQLKTIFNKFYHFFI
ncbi:hypothetical protein HMPREF1141_1353 [Clostridium sp. MSTE9]|nr:hypothetical protein HMPREF1141_1353 [Clostridium sp. MSTE9]